MMGGIGMKLVMAVVTDKDSHSLLAELIKEGYRATKLSSTGGFLKEGNTTLLMGVDDDRVDHVFSVIQRICQVRKQLVTPISPLPGPAESYIPYAVEVPVGGAIVFVLDIEKYLKV